jgi:hypothetical protein
MKTSSKTLILSAVALAFSLSAIPRIAIAQTGNPPGTRTLASLLAEGYEMQETRLFRDKISMRKADGSGIITHVCDRGRIGSATFEAYRNKNYDEVLCAPTQ